MYISLIYSDSEKSKRKQSNMARNSKRSAIPSHAPIADSDSPGESKNNRPRFKKQRIKFEACSRRTWVTFRPCVTCGLFLYVHRMRLTRAIAAATVNF